MYGNRLYDSVLDGAETSMESAGSDVGGVTSALMGQLSIGAKV
jgi:hypothetical protein